MIMEMLYQVLGLVGAGIIVWYLYRVIKSRPDQFSRDKLNHSFRSMGILAVLLILFVSFLVLVVRHS
jgi:hypothetical protein